MPWTLRLPQVERDALRVQRGLHLVEPMDVRMQPKLLPRMRIEDEGCRVPQTVQVERSPTLKRQRLRRLGAWRIRPR